MWFANDDEVDDGESIVPMSDVLKNKLDADFDQINRLLENRRGKQKNRLEPVVQVWKMISSAYHTSNSQGHNFHKLLFSTFQKYYILDD